MKKNNGFIIPFLIVIIAALLIGGGAYIYSYNKKIGIETNVILPNTLPVNSETTNEITVPGMKKYIDVSFGFSFWYPDTWTVKEDVVTGTQSPYTEGTIIKSLIVSSPDPKNDNPIYIKEFVSSDKSIKDNSDPGPADRGARQIQYYFDSNTHKWMMKEFLSNSQSQIKEANISQNTMGGLHIFSGTARFGGDTIVPISAKNFVIAEDFSAGDNQIYLVPTIAALNPAVATPVSPSEQIQTIRAEGLQYGAIGNRLGYMWFVDSNNVYDRFGHIMSETNPKIFTLIDKYSDGTKAGDLYATDNTRVYYGGGENGGDILVGADPKTFILLRQSYQIPYATSSGRYGKSFTGYEGNFAKDKSHVWYMGKLIPGADPNSLVITGNKYIPNKDGSYTIAHDANHIYSETGNDYRIEIDGVLIK